MTFSYPVLWLVLLIVFAGVEGLTAGLISIWFCAGSLVALFASWGGLSLGVQIGLFAVVSVLAMALVRPLARKYWQPSLVKTNADRILDQEGLVIQTIDNRLAQGQIKVGGAVWTARSAQEDQRIPEGTLVTVERIEGVKAIVHPAPGTDADEPKTEA
jgi:membrane protein implicated in regulation of membrane protease activity